MDPVSSSPHTPAGRSPSDTIGMGHWHTPHVSALPLLATMTATLLLAIAIIVLAATGNGPAMEAAAYRL